MKTNGDYIMQFKISHLFLSSLEGKQMYFMLHP